MKEIAFEFLTLIENKGYKAYIVGGFVRDYLMGITSNDIDITTNATPQDLKKIFPKFLSNKNLNKLDSYGSVRIIYKNILFEVTTFREELEYLDSRHPSSIKYVDDLIVDLKRRDFTINAICMNKKGEIIDPLNGYSDIKKKIIRTINDSKKSFQDDALRILRAVRFSVTLDFSLDDELLKALSETKHLLKKISYERKKIELDKIFASKRAKEGLELIKKLELDKNLDLENLDRIKDYTDLIGIWSMINSSSYRFSKKEKEMIKKVNEVYELNNLNPYTLYKYGLYVNVLAGTNKGLSKKEITEEYNKLPIKSQEEIMITAIEICNLLKRKPDAFLNKIYGELEIEIISGRLKNEKKEIITYLEKNQQKLENNL